MSNTGGAPALAALARKPALSLPKAGILEPSNLPDDLAFILGVLCGFSLRALR
jgi:hypothetical protein